MKPYRSIGLRVQVGSLASKLLMLRPGETFYLDDPRDSRTAAPLDRVVQSAAAKSNALRDRRFSTQGWIAVRPSPVCAKRILAITRVDHMDG
jgi:hypothetical protein